MEVATAPNPSTREIGPNLEKTRHEREKDAMASNQTVHSSYVPAQLHRHLQFLDFNAGKLLPVS